MAKETDEEFEFNDSLDVSDDVSASSYQRMLLFDNIKQELTHSYSKVILNNQNKYLHKQSFIIL